MTVAKMRNLLQSLPDDAAVAFKLEGTPADVQEAFAAEWWLPHSTASIPLYVDSFSHGVSAEGEHIFGIDLSVTGDEGE